MKRKLATLILALILLTQLIPVLTTIAEEPGTEPGNGTAASLFIAPIDTNIPRNAIPVSTAAELAAIGGAQSNGRYYILVNDIDLVDAWVPIDDFRGTLDGQGYSINNLHMSLDPRDAEPADAGLFGSITRNATIRNIGVNIGLQGIFVFGGITTRFNSTAGGLIGYVGGGNNITVENSFVIGNITNPESVHFATNAGGLIGLYEGGGNDTLTIRYSYAIGYIAGRESAGGLIGHVSTGKTTTIEGCYFEGDVYSSNWPIGGVAGGLAGEIDNTKAGATTTIKNSYAVAGVRDDDDTYNKGVTGGQTAGGLIGIVSGEGATVYNCFATGDIGSSWGSGGLIGWSRDTIIKNCYSWGQELGASTRAGGLIGYNENSTVTNSYRSTWEIWGTDINEDGILLTETELRDPSSFENWDFESVWGFKDGANNGFPVLRVFGGIETAVESVSLDRATASVTIGFTEQLTATIFPFYATNHAVTWSSSAPAIAGVDGNGLVSGLAEGIATITATAVDNGKTASITVSVTNTGIDYTPVADVIVPGRIGGRTGTIIDGFSINLTKETIQIPSTYRPLLFSIDDGQRWRAVKDGMFSDDRFPRMLNRPMSLRISDREIDRSTRQPQEGAQIVSFATIFGRAALPRLSVNFALGADLSGDTSGTWVLTRQMLPPNADRTLSKRELRALMVTVIEKEGMLIAEADATRRQPNERGYGRFHGLNGTANGIVVKPLPSDNRVIKSTYFIRIGAERRSDTDFRAASRPRRINIRGQGRAPNYRIRDNVIRVRAGTGLLLGGQLESFSDRTDVNVSGRSGEAELWINATARRAATKKQPLTIP
jgi:hypothetical protein